MDPIATVPLRLRTGVEAGLLRLWTTRGATLVPAVITEGAEYRYEVELHDGTVQGVMPEELLDRDAGARSGGGWTGRLRTRNRVGTLEVEVVDADGAVARGYIDVHSTKLDYENQYRWMLAGVAQEGAALLLQSFAPTTIRLTPDLTADATTLYQQVAFLGAILRRPHTIEAVERVLRSPHVAYEDTVEDVPVGRGLPGSSSAVRAVSRPGDRIAARPGLSVPTLPAHVRHGRLEATIDNPPNQFVRHALEAWSSILDRARRTIGDDTERARHGRREVGELSDIVEGWRTDRRLRDVGRLERIPSGNQVLLRKPGYREIHQAVVESRAAALLRWDGADAVVDAGQRDVATLYEYWCYLELRRIVERLCDFSESSQLTELTADEMHLVLKRGRQQMVNGFTTRRGRQIDLELWFNRSFSGAESWTLQMRPDCSLRLQADGPGDERVETWVHFDAKYRVDAIADLFVDDEEATGRRARRGDLLKMHAYRDAIRQSSGAYVLFPGDDERVMREHGEILPGLGAFAFVPGSDGHATVASAGRVGQFIDELLDHAAEQASNRERADYWLAESHRRPAQTSSAFTRLRRPPADTTVLIGYYRSPAHLTWIEAQGIYNMRLGSRAGAIQPGGEAAAAELLLLWSTGTQAPRVWWLRPELLILGEEEMRQRGYPSTPHGQYLCRILDTELVDVDALVGWRGPSTDGQFGAPHVVSWADLVGEGPTGR